MKFYQAVLLIVVLAVLNNVVLSLLFSTPSRHSTSSLPKTQATAAIISNTLQKKQAISNLTNSLNDQEILITNVLERFTESDELAAILDDFYRNINRRNEERQAGYMQLSAADLVSLVLNTESAFERQEALIGIIFNQKDNELETSELKSLYDGLDTNDSYKYSVLDILVYQRNDPESLALAKQLIMSKDVSFLQSTGSLRIVEAVYQQDPQFFEDFATPLKLADLPLSAIRNMLNSPKFAETFYKNNIDEILKSGSHTIRSRVRQFNFELDDEQQSMLAGMVAADNPKKREFALNLVGKIKDIDRLRDSYSALSRNKDKKIFLRRLLRQQKNSNQYKLAIELVNDSDLDDFKVALGGA